MSTVSEAKVALRQQLRAEAGRHTAIELMEASRAICARIQEQRVWREANSVLFYVPLSTEPDLQPLIHTALATRKTVALPRYDASAGTYQVCRITDPKGQLVSGQYAIPEPSLECPVVELNKLDLAVVPGIGFTLDGCRLGRGKGHFDRILGQVQGWKCGVAFDWQVIVEIPAEPHDIRLDSIVTPSHWHVVRERL